MTELVQERARAAAADDAAQMVIASLSSHFGDRLSTGRALREQHATP